jgi:hypothetical protein
MHRRIDPVTTQFLTGVKNAMPVVGRLPRHRE